MPGIALETTMSTGHACYPPTPSQGPYANTAFINGRRVQLKGRTMYVQHQCGRTVHTPQMRIISSGSSTFYLEGLQVARIGDSIACGDKISEGSGDAFVA
jgi:uncharacterized Zn-binding protein involved in type VI secretion